MTFRTDDLESINGYIERFLAKVERVKSGDIRKYTGYLKNMGIKIEWDEMKKCGSCPAFEWSDKYKDGKCLEKNQFLSEYYPGRDEYVPQWCPMTLKPRD